MKVKDIAALIEGVAPREFQESYDNAGLAVGSPTMEVTGVVVCLDVSEQVVEEPNSQQVYGSFLSVGMNFPKVVADFPKVVGNFPKVDDDFPKVDSHFPKVDGVFQR